MTDVGYDAFDDPYCYPGTDVLRNKAGLRDAEALEAFELEMTTLRSEEPLPNGRFGIMWSNSAGRSGSYHRAVRQDKVGLSC
jgi:fido (protein-threonine AMPylation protein)